MARVSLSNITKQFGEVKVIHDVSLEIDAGEFVILVGPSGCGKSTLLRMIAGLEDISGGEVSIGGSVVNEMAPKERDIAMVFQNYALYPHMTVAENMGYSLKIARVAKDERARQVRVAAGILGLTELLDRLPKQLSGGQRQRVAMGRAIVRDPKVFLFDEPLSNLDAKLRVAMRGEIKTLHQRLKTTIVYVTHDQIEAMTMADRIVVMNAGRIEQVGTPLELFDKPVSVFVASFIGSPSMNLIECTLEVESGSAGARLAGGQLWPAKNIDNARSGREILLGVRPEHFSIVESGGNARALKAEVTLVEPTGSETQVTLSAAGKKIMVIFRERVGAQPGDILALEPDFEKIHIFDKATGHRISA